MMKTTKFKRLQTSLLLIGIVLLGCTLFAISKRSNDQRIASSVNSEVNTSIKVADLNEWAFNLAWLDIQVSVTNDTAFVLESKLKRITLYDYEQKGLWHNFEPGKKQSRVDFSFIALGTVGIAKRLGINAAFSNKVKGFIDLETGIGSFSMD